MRSSQCFLGFCTIPEINPIKPFQYSNTSSQGLIYILSWYHVCIVKEANIKPRKSKLSEMKSTSVGLTKVTGGRRVHDLEINQQELYYLRERKKLIEPHWFLNSIWSLTEMQLEPLMEKGVNNGMGKYLKI